MPHLTLSQRYQIGSLRHLRPAEIARRIGKHRSVVTRELARNGPTAQAYQPQTAHKRAAQRKKANALKTTPVLTDAIAQGLGQQWSPDQIKGRCQQQGQAMLSRSAIYAYIWRDQRQGGQLYKNLRHAHRPYRKRLPQTLRQARWARQSGPPGSQAQHRAAAGGGRRKEPLRRLGARHGAGPGATRRPGNDNRTHQ